MPESVEGRLHPYYATKALIDALPNNAIIVCDGGESSIWVRDHVRTKGEGSFLIVGYLGTLGVGQGYAMGAARAYPDRPVYLFAGDGGVGFHIQEFDTMVRHSLNIHTVVLNNACWGMSQNGQDLMYGKQSRSIVELADTSYDVVAEGFGCKGIRIERMDEIAAAINETKSAALPYCINVRIDESVINPYTYVMIGLAAPQEGESEVGGVVIPYYDNIDN
jgi:acetolactate synthase-1/2/3 large subunit